MLFIIFFFQAEDGIRDGRVTGVKTCALPISSWRSPGPTAESSSRPRANGCGSVTSWQSRVPTKRSKRRRPPSWVGRLPDVRRSRSAEQLRHRVDREPDQPTDQRAVDPDELQS